MDKKATQATVLTKEGRKSVKLRDKAQIERFLANGWKTPPAKNDSQKKD